jgi:hypothetical protein
LGILLIKSGKQSLQKVQPPMDIPDDGKRLVGAGHSVIVRKARAL